MVTKLKSILINSALTMALGLSFSCASDQQQGQSDQLESQEDYEDQGDDSDEGNALAGEQEENQEEYNEQGGNETNNYNSEDEELNDANLGENDDELGDEAEVTEDNLNEGYNEENAYGESEALVNDSANEGELDEVIDEMNEGNATNLDENAEMAEEIPVENTVVEETPMEEVPMEETAVTDAVVGTQAAPGLPELGSKMSYIVQKGDSLVKIATRVYGSPMKWTEIASFTGLANPKLIYPGDVVYYQLTDQTLAFASAYETLPRSEVQIMNGDTLSSIAGRVLGNPENWKTIWRHNDNISNPDKLTAGTTIYYVDPGMLASAVKDIKVKFAQKVIKTVKTMKIVEKNVRAKINSTSRV